MGKKTVLVPFSDTVPVSSMFCQSKETLLKIYEELELDGMYGCIIRPLLHSNGGYFFYRKVMPNGKMLVCGECYPQYKKEDYTKDLYYLDEDHAPNTVFFVDEDSLTNDDESAPELFDEYKSQQKKDLKLQQELQKLEKSKPRVKETRVYIVNVNKCDLIGMSTSDEEFIAEAERQGTVFSLQGFEKAFNYDDITSDNCLMRII